MPLTATSAARTGIASATRQIDASAHNLANLGTEDFRPLRAHQQARAEGGSFVTTEQAPAPEEVSIERELVQMETASVQAKASMRAIETELDLIGSLVDLEA